MIIEVNVRPSSGKEEIIKVNDKSYKIFLKKPSIDNKANIELLKLLSRHFKKEVNIIRGKTSKRKLIEVKDG